MSHHTTRMPFRQLATRLNRFPQGAPQSELLYKILAILFSAEEAGLVSRLPLRPFTAAGAARIWKVPEKEALTTLEKLASRAILLDLEKEGEMVYLLPPPMAGFFEFSLMRARTDIDQKALSELLFQYLNVEDAFITELFARGETSIVRVFVNETAVGGGTSSVVLDYERASEVIRTARHLAVGLCYCRHKMSHLGRSCDAPQEICMTLNSAAASLIRHGTARSMDVAEGLDILQEARSRHLVQCGDNVREGVNFICHCCGCCCEALLAVRRLAVPHPILTTNFIPRIRTEVCSGCGTCSTVCPVAAVALVDSHDTQEPGRRKAVLDETTCLGCGVCARACSCRAIDLVARKQRAITPVNSAHRVVLMAIERGMLPQLIFDNQAHLSHRLMAAVLGVIQKLPPVKQLLASRQLKSRYVERLLQGRDLEHFSRSN